MISHSSLTFNEDLSPAKVSFRLRYVNDFSVAGKRVRLSVPGERCPIGVIDG